MPPSRRTVLTSALAGVAVAGLGGARLAGAQDTVAVAEHPLPVSDDLALHAARRLSYGATPVLVEHLRRVGLSAWLDEQLTETPDLSGTTLGTTTVPLPVVVLGQTRATGRNPVRDLQVATFARAVWGDHQLYELIVEFWSNHLSLSPASPGVGDHKVADDRDVVRAHALGSFSDLLVASSQSPAMLRYLSNASSRGRQPNENYARELLELHTVGVHGGYLQRDVHDTALALTGLTVDDTTGLFTYRPEWHATGPLRVLGWAHPNADASSGLQVATSLLQYLARHPATARHLATKLVRRFVSDAPPPGLVASAAQVYLTGRTAITPVIRHIALSRDFARSAGQKNQRPYEWFAAAVRTLALRQQPSLSIDGGGVVPLLEQLGQAPFGWHPPDGYPDVAAAWASTAPILSRWNTAQALVNGAIAAFGPLDIDALVGTPVPATAGVLVDRIVHRLLSISTRPALRAALLRSTGLRGSTVIDQSVVRRLTPPLAALILSSPEAQIR